MIPQVPTFKTAPSLQNPPGMQFLPLRPREPVAETGEADGYAGQVAGADSFEPLGTVSSSRANPGETGSQSFRDTLKYAVKAHLAMLPAPVAEALGACEMAAGAVGSHEYDSEPVRQAVSAICNLALEIEPGVLDQVSLASEISESRRFLEGFLLPTDNRPELAARGQVLMSHLEEASPALLHARVIVMDGPSLMAFGRGGENLFIGQDVLKLPEDETAAVLAHERVHLLERHMTKVQICHDVAGNLALLASPSPAAAASIRVLGDLAAAGLQREQEFIADSGGCSMLRSAGYDPAAMKRVLTRLVGTAPESQGPRDDHPPLSARLAALI